MRSLSTNSTLLEENSNDLARSLCHCSGLFRSGLGCCYFHQGSLLIIPVPNSERPAHFGWSPKCGHEGRKILCVDTEEEVTCQACLHALGKIDHWTETRSSSLTQPPKSDRECVGQALARYRISRKIRQHEMGLRLGVTRQGILNRESGHTDVAVRELLHFCDSPEQACQIIQEAWEAFAPLRGASSPTEK